ncbi:MAG: hypothetical protein Q9170_007583 [Blastenia crenularia]
MFTVPPFALFALEDLPTSTLNSLLEKAKDGSTVDVWWWYLAKPDYRSAPHRKPDGPGVPGTAAPIEPSFSSAFVGKSLEDVVQWLTRKPKDVSVDSRFFGVLDKKAVDGKVAICRINDMEPQAEVAWCILKKVEESTLYLGGLDSNLDWNEDVEHGKYILDI